MAVVVDLTHSQRKCSELNQEFMLQLDPLGKGIPDGDNFDIFCTTVSDGVISNVPSLSFPLQYTPPMAPDPLCISILILIMLYLRIILFKVVFLVT